MEQRDQTGVAIAKAIVLLQPSTDKVRAARQTLCDPSLQSGLLLFAQSARAAFMAKIAQPLHTLLLICAKPAAHRIIVKQQRSGHLGATPALVEQNNRIGSPRQPMLRKPVPRHVDKRSTLICRKKAAANHVANSNRSGYARQAGFRLLDESEYLSSPPGLAGPSGHETSLQLPWLVGGPSWWY